jgi:hypothetical protein
MELNQRVEFICAKIRESGTASFSDIRQRCGYYAVGYQGEARLRLMLERTVSTGLVRELPNTTYQVVS